ncbi:DUF4283 domain-containing protein [Cephalotus follicularis]|uniref:DUF4283 domain-containing protein n=1 Tax=Cephalotus follicularis TaxID=3775 RepID=A0A1Q3D956_CEPFO|nr:DUF4283 domain-containing protein [Cephalotus follicularis]
MDVKLASEFHSYSLVAKFSLLRPPVDLFEHHVNSSWGLSQSATVGLIDPKHILIHLQSNEDFAKAWSRESKIFDNRRFLFLRWTPDFTKKKDSSYSATWLRLPGLPLPCQNPAILEVIGNSFGRFLRLDERTKKMKHPMAPRMCVEMNLAFKLPDVVVIAIGTEESFHQKIEYDLRIGFCNFCHLQGHHETNCRKKLSQAAPPAAEPSSSSPQGIEAISISNVAMVGAALPVGTSRPLARRPTRAPVTKLTAINSHPPPVPKNAPVSSNTQPSTQLPPSVPSPQACPNPTSSVCSQPPQSAVTPSIPLAPTHPAPSGHTMDAVNDHPSIVLHNNFDMLRVDDVTPLPAPAVTLQTNQPQQPPVDVNQIAPLSLALSVIPNVPAPSSGAEQPLVSQQPDNQAPSPQPVLQALTYAPILACTQAAHAILRSPSCTAQDIIQPLLNTPLPIQTSQSVEPILALCDTTLEPQQICTLNTADSVTSSFVIELPFSHSPGSISSASKRVQSSGLLKKAKHKGQLKGSLSATKKGAPLPSSS